MEQSIRLSGKNLSKGAFIIGLLFCSAVLWNSFTMSAQTDTPPLSGQATDKALPELPAQGGGDPQQNPVYSIPIPANVNLAGEPVPVGVPDVRERLDRELLVNSYWHSNMLLTIKRANKIFPIIEPILKRHAIPDDFKYLAAIESSLTNAVSAAGARGIWQLMKETAQSFGMEVNDNVDERYSYELSTEAACKYLKAAYEKFGSWTLAAASYNMGVNGLRNRLDKQGVDNYYDLLLSEETSRYVLRIVAIKQIMSNPEQYGFKLTQEELYAVVPADTVCVDTTITNLNRWAIERSINYKILKIHNPWLREQELHNRSGKAYKIAVPEPSAYRIAPLQPLAQKTN